MFPTNRVGNNSFIYFICSMNMYLILVLLWSLCFSVSSDVLLGSNLVDVSEILFMNLSDSSFGISSAYIGVNPEGLQDIAVGDFNHNRLWILTLNGTKVQNYYIIDNDKVVMNGNFFGRSVSNIGDLDGDGNVDIAVGASCDNDDDMCTGAVYILFLNQNRTLKFTQKISSLSGGLNETLPFNSYLGTSISYLGEMENDGLVSIAVGGHGDGDGVGGFIWILSLNSSGIVKRKQQISYTDEVFNGTISVANYFGVSSSSSDIDGDGTLDLLVGAHFTDDGGTQRGAVWILFLNRNGTVRESQKISNTTGGFKGSILNGDLFGTSVAGIGDINGDGIPDIAVGAQGDRTGGTNSGSVWILYLAKNGTVKDYFKLYRQNIGSINSGDFFGSSITLLGDQENFELLVSSLRGISDISLRIIQLNGTSSDDDDISYELCPPCFSNQGDCIISSNGTYLCECYPRFSGDLCQKFTQSPEQGTEQNITIQGNISVSSSNISGLVKVNGSATFTSSTVIVDKQLVITGDLTLIGSEIFLSGDESEIQVIGSLTMKNLTSLPPNTQIKVSGCAYFSGDLILSSLPDGEKVNLISYDCHEGEFDSVTISGCQVEPEYGENNFFVLFEVAICFPQSKACLSLIPLIGISMILLALL
eukprot:TRINITY_DN1591_c0_g3_i1.p1 TRINITY_DN1591_c0_g3~~TRINITY_DN1591_c0_g3_i1.p1  ORF type:complete len:646 (-),score=157.72 TRINITY_DN1591_c0_g3_i1:308-2245(-)